MTEEEWLTITDPQPVLESGGLTDMRKLRLFCVSCCNRVLHHFFDDRSRIAVSVAEQFADGLVGIEVLAAANEQAYSARSLQENNFYTLDAGWYCSQQPLHARWCADTCAAAAGLGVPLERFDEEIERAELGFQAALLRDIFGNPFRPVVFALEWRTDTAVTLARQMYESREFGAMPILADALQDAGCDEPAILDHCRAPGEHVRGCWVVDLVLGKG